MGTTDTSESGLEALIVESLVVTDKVDVRGLGPAEPLPAGEQIDDGIHDQGMLAANEPDLVEEAGDD